MLPPYVHVPWKIEVHIVGDKGDNVFRREGTIKHGSLYHLLNHSLIYYLIVTTPQLGFNKDPSECLICVTRITAPKWMIC